MKDWELTTDGDLRIGENTDYIVEDRDELVQRLKVRLYWFLKEWYLDIAQGIDYFGKVLAKGTGLIEIEQEFRRQILLTKDITGITDISLNPEADRSLKVDFTASSIYGDIEITELELP